MSSPAITEMLEWYGSAQRNPGIPEAEAGELQFPGHLELTLTLYVRRKG